MRTLLTLFLGCTTWASPLTVAAASDLSRVGPALAAAYRSSTGQEVRFSFGSSGALLRQIENGAPFDVFLSANEAYVNEGLKKGYLRAGTEVVYASGKLAIWSRSGRFRRLEELREPTVLHIALANPAYAPYGAAAVQALQKAGLWKAVESRLVYGENIRQTLQYAESGNADAALVAWSHVFDSGGVLVPDTLYAEVRQAGAIVKITTAAAAAERFLQFLKSAPGQDVLHRYGFSRPSR